MEFNNDFRHDLKVGQVGEQLLADILQGKTVEVKRDFWISRSENLAVEFESRGKPSGIATSEADYWAFIAAGEVEDEIVLLIKTSRLKKIAKLEKQKGNIKAMGDNNTSLSVLVKWGNLLKYKIIKK